MEPFEVCSAVVVDDQMATASRRADHFHGLTNRIHPSLSFAMVAFLPGMGLFKFAMYSAYETSIFRIASSFIFAQLIGSCSQSGLLSCVWSPRYRGDVFGQPKSLTRYSVGRASQSDWSDSIDIFSQMLESSDIVKTRGAVQSRGAAWCVVQRGLRLR
jgi:hypothetical protein